MLLTWVRVLESTIVGSLYDQCCCNQSVLYIFIFIGKLLFCGCLNNETDLTDWKRRIKNADLIPTQLLELCLKFWCQNALASSSYVNMMEKMYQVIKELSDLEGI